MPTVNDIVIEIEKIAKPQYAYEWDNCGLLAGNKSDYVQKVLVSLDITKEESETLPVGYQTGWLKFTNELGEAGTQDLQIKFLILPKEVDNVTNL